MMFKFSAACLSSVVLASSLNVTSNCQCILSTLQWPLTAIKAYIQNQLKEDLEYDQMSLVEYIDLFTGEPVKKNKK